jgi:putative endonuclease
MHPPHSLGAEGERLAARHLSGAGYRIIARNYRFHRNEIDIIATDATVLCFIEVKTRGSLEKGHPAESVTLRKQQEIIRAATGYLATLKGPLPDCRFDVIAILATRVEESAILEYRLDHIKAAFMA